MTEKTDIDLPAPAEKQLSEFKCKLCAYITSLRSEWMQHLWGNHGLTEQAYEEHVPGQPLPRVLETMTVERVHPPTSEPTPAEPVVTMRLMDIESNPVRVPVEARPSCVYHFERGKWQGIPAPDARLLLPSELSPGLYGHLRFEKKPPRKRKRRGQ